MIDASIMTIVDMRPADRLLRAAALNRAADALALAGLRRRLPTASPHELGVALAIQRLGVAASPKLIAFFSKETCVSDTSGDFLAVAARAASVCDQLGLGYLIGGGVASTVHGEFRTTRDVDLIVRVPLAQAGVFATALGQAFTLHPPDLLDALARIPEVKTDRRQRATFAAYDRSTGYRLDVFCVSDSEYDTAQLSRAIAIDIAEANVTLRIASAEDTVLTKLEWYSITPSDRQWDDVQAIFRVQGDTLDAAYLDEWADKLAITPLLTAARRSDKPPHHTQLDDSTTDPRQTRMDI